MIPLEPFSWISIGGMTQGTLLAVILAIRSWRDRSARRTNLLLSGLLLIGVYVVLIMWLYGTRLIVDIPALIGTQTPVAFLFGPLIYLFFRSWVRDAGLNIPDAAHFIPFVAYALYLAPLYALPAAAKIDGILGAFYGDTPGFRSMQTLHMSALLLHLAAYVGASWKMCLQDQVTDQMSVRTAIGLAGVLWAFVLLRFALTSVTSATTAGTVHIIPGVIALSLSGIALAGLKGVTDRVASTGRRDSHALSRPEPGEIAELRTHMEMSRPYLDPDLSLADLADALELRPDQLSRLLNDGIGESFTDFVNRYRISHAAEMLRSPRYDHLSIAAVGTESGFNSRSTFYRAFRQFRSMTPGAFQKSARITRTSCPES